jgi:hypothetical protein
MARLLPEGPEAELVASSISEHPEVAEAEHALRRLGRLLSCGPKGNRNVLRWTTKGRIRGSWFLTISAGSSISLEAFDTISMAIFLAVPNQQLAVPH